MKDEQILRWLIEFGSDWVYARLLALTWADRELHWRNCVEKGLLERKVDILRVYYRLTPKALERIDDGQGKPLS